MIGAVAGAFISSSVVVAVIGALVTATLVRRKSREEEYARGRTVFAEALEACAAYRECPYAIRRRRVDQPEAERQRLSEAIREIQVRITYYSGWTAAESESVGIAYARLVDATRAAAGRAMHDAWLMPPIVSDADMNIAPGTFDMSEIAEMEARYLEAVRMHLRSVAPWWGRRISRRRRSLLSALPSSARASLPSEATAFLDGQSASGGT